MTRWEILDLIEAKIGMSYLDDADAVLSVLADAGLIQIDDDKREIYSDLLPILQSTMDALQTTAGRVEFVSELVSNTNITQEQVLGLFNGEYRE